MPSADDCHYRSSYPEITLPPTGRVPRNARLDLSAAERDRWLGLIGDAWTSAEGMQGGRRLPDVQPLPTEVARAWRLWLGSHHAFFPLYGLLAETYDQMVSARDARDTDALRKWARRSADLNRGAGALLALGMDFEPTMEIYERFIRAEMPEAFSGYWLREAAAVAKSRRAWTSGEFGFESAVEARKLEAQSRSVYDRYHREVMRRSVADGRSLANKYRHMNGWAHEITAGEFDTYDRWFRIRRTELSRLGFLNSTCRAVRLAVESVVTGTRLDNETIGELSVGLKTTLCVMAEWLGAPTESSNYYPKTHRGE